MYKSNWTKDNLPDDKRILLIKTVKRAKSKPFKGLSKEEKNEHYKKGEQFFIENKNKWASKLAYDRGHGSSIITQINHCVSDKLILILEKMFARNEDPQTIQKKEIPIEQVVYYYKRNMTHFNVKMKCIMIGNAILKEKKQFIDKEALKAAREMVQPLFACSNNSNNASIIIKSIKNVPLMFDFVFGGIFGGRQLPNFIINTTEKITRFINRSKNPKSKPKASTSSQKRARIEITDDDEPSPKVLVLPSHKEVRMASSVRTSVTPTCSSSVVPEIETEIDPPAKTNNNDKDQLILQHTIELDKILDGNDQEGLDRNKRIIQHIGEIKSNITKLYFFVGKIMNQTCYIDFLKELKTINLFHDVVMMEMFFKRQEFDLEQFIDIIDILKKHLLVDVAIISKLIDGEDNTKKYRQLTKNFATVLAKPI